MHRMEDQTNLPHSLTEARLIQPALAYANHPPPLAGEGQGRGSASNASRMDRR